MKSHRFAIGLFVLLAILVPGISSQAQYWPITPEWSRDYTVGKAPNCYGFTQVTYGAKGGDVEHLTHFWWGTSRFTVNLEIHLVLLILFGSIALVVAAIVAVSRRKSGG